MASTINASTSSGLVNTADTSGVLQLQTANTTAVTIDTAQGVTFAGNTTVSKAQAIQYLTNTTGTNSVYSQYTNTGGTAYVGLNNSSGGDFGNSAYAMQLFHTGAYPIVFSTTGTERMRIDSSGNLLIGTTSANGKATINQTNTGERTITAASPASYAATAFRSDSAATSGTGWYHLYGSSSGGTNNIFIYGNGNIQNANNSYGAISDIKLKENIVDASPKLDKLMNVKVRTYNLKGEYEQHKQIGVIAQELETIFPSLIEETKDRGENDEVLETTTKSVKYSVFVPMLIKALQELNAKVDAQATLITDLTTRLAALEGAK